MTSVRGVDLPEGDGEIEVTVPARGVSVSARVERVGPGGLVVRPSVGGFVEQAVVSPGDPVQVFWRWGVETRVLPAEVLRVEHGAVVRWRLGITGAAEASQRRAAVRARIAIPVEIGFGSFQLTGEAVDVSEAGLQASCEGFGILPESGDRLELVLRVEDGEPLRTTAEIVRIQARGARWVMSLRFVDLPEREGDRLRRRVFQALREERSRMAD